MSPDLCELVYAAADNAGFLQRCVWRAQIVMVGLQRADHNVLNGLTQSSDSVMTYPAGSLRGLKTGDEVRIGRGRYQVREVVALSDGSEKRATLTLL